MTRLFEAKPFIICEIGSNWRNLTDCCDSIKAAKDAGADAVKFQAFDCDALYGMPFDYIDTELGHGEASACSVYNSTLPLAWLPKLKEVADAVGIEFLCTAFSPELVAAVDPYVEVHKVASSDLAYPQLLQAVARTGKPVLWSTGASSEEEIEEAMNHLELACDVRWDFLVPLYCVSGYPARTVDLRVLKMLWNMTGLAPGFSDHTTDIIGHPVHAAELGAVCIEKHFTAFPDLDTPDRPHSLTPSEFKLMVEHIRGVKQPEIGPTYEEQAMVLRHKRRLIATKDLEAGTSVLIYGQTYGAYRSLVDDTHGLSPFAWRDVEGRIAQKDIKRGQSIGLGDFGEAF